jgi:hypothetical protein
MRTRSRRRRCFYVLIPLGALLAAYVAIGMWIGTDVREAAATAQARFGGDPVAALCALAESDREPLELRNRSVWAIGQIGDPSALPHLERLRTGAPCVHDREVCQREVEKAIAACRGSFNAAAPVWRHGFARS